MQLKTTSAFFCFLFLILLPLISCDDFKSVTVSSYFHVCALPTRFLGRRSAVVPSWLVIFGIVIDLAVYILELGHFVIRFQSLEEQAIVLLFTRVPILLFQLYLQSSFLPIVPTWPAQAVVLLARAIPSRGMAAKHASDDTSDVTRASLSGKSIRNIPGHAADRRSRNCTKHNCRCDYMDVAAANEQSPRPMKGPDLLMSPEIEIEIENWHSNGVPPFLELSQCPRSGWYGLSRIQLRLIHHIIGLSIDLHRRGFSSCTVWAQKLPK